MEKIVVNKSLCIGCGACVAICPEHFNFDENNLSNVIKETTGENNNNLQEAVDACPTNAISISVE